jgi:hypothetical protein
MYRVPPDRAWWPAVGAPLERGVRTHSAVHTEHDEFLVLVLRQAIADGVVVAFVCHEDMALKV